MNGFFKLQRSFFSHHFWEEDRSFSRAEAWLDLLQLAAFKATKRIVKGGLITLEPGQLCGAERYLADRWKWSTKKVRAFLALLESDEMITIEKKREGSIITLSNYSRYAEQIIDQEAQKKHQGSADAAFDELLDGFQKKRGGSGESYSSPEPYADQESSKEAQKKRGGSINEAPGKQIEERKEGEEHQEEESSASAPITQKPFKQKSKGTIEEVRAFAVQNGLPASDGEAMFYKWEGNGWMNGRTKIKDWQATIRAWKSQGYLPSQKNPPSTGTTNIGRREASRFAGIQEDFDLP